MSRSERVILMDGAMGTMLLPHAASADSCLDQFNLTRPALVLEIHKSYLDAGAHLIVTNTFGANRPRLSLHHQESHLKKINRAGVRIARKAAGRRPVFASIGPLGRGAKRMSPAEMHKYFLEQARCLETEEPSGYLIETMMSLGEAEAATIAVREVSRRLIIASMGLPAGSDRAVGETLEIIASTLRAAGADILGANCGTHPEDCYTFLKALSLVDDGPFCARPSAGLPNRLMIPEEFSAWGPKFKKLGCRWIGGCCGTTPAHIRKLRESLSPS